MAPRWPKIAPKWAQCAPQDRAKTWEGCKKSLLGAFSNHLNSRYVRDGPKMSQDGPKMNQDSPKMAPRRPKIDPRRSKMTPGRPKMVPRWSKIAPKWAQDAPQNRAKTWEGCKKSLLDAIRPQDGTKMAQDRPQDSSQNVKKRVVAECPRFIHTFVPQRAAINQLPIRPHYV